MLDRLKKVTLGQCMVMLPLVGTIASGSYLALVYVVKDVIAEERVVKQESIDKFEVLLKALQDEQYKAGTERSIIQNDLGTIKAFQREQKEDFKDYQAENNKALREILSGVRGLSSN